MAIELSSPEESRFREAQVALLLYREIIEKALAALPRELSEEEKNSYRFVPEEVRASVVGWVEKQKRTQVEVAFPQMARYSLVVLIFSMMETQAHYFCDALLALKTLTLRWIDLRGDVLERLHVYAVKLGKLGTPNSDTWQEARSFEHIRHCIVHADGEVARSQYQKHLRQLVGKMPGYGIDDAGRISLSAETVLHAIQVFSTLFNHFLKEAGFPEQVITI